MELRGKLALVTGGSDGIGREIALQLQGLGADVTVTGRSAEKLQAMAALGFGTIVGDLSQESGIDAVVSGVAGKPLALRLRILQAVERDLDRAVELRVAAAVDFARPLLDFDGRCDAFVLDAEAVLGPDREVGRGDRAAVHQGGEAEDADQAAPGALADDGAEFEASLDLAEDEELMNLMGRAGFQSVFIGIESPNEASLKETKKLQNVRSRAGSLIERVHRIQDHGLDVWCGMIVGFDSDDASVFDALPRFLAQSHIANALVGLLHAETQLPWALVIFATALAGLWVCVLLRAK